jgi:hypothetical protein
MAEYKSVFQDPKEIPVAVSEGNAAGQTELAEDMRFGSDALLAKKYGPEAVAQRREMTAARNDKLYAERASRNVGQIAGDTALGGAQAFVGMVGGAEATLLRLGEMLGEKVAPGFANQESLSTGVAETTSDVTSYIDSLKSQELQDRNALAQVGAKLDADDSAARAVVADTKSQAKYDADIASGASETLADWSKLGRDFMNSTSRVITDTGSAIDRVASDGAVAGDVIAQGLGSLGPSAKLAQGGIKVAEALMGKVTSHAGAAKLATVLGSSGGIGAAEASGVYMDTVNTVMGRTHEEMLSSAPYNALIADGVDPEVAKSQVAASTGMLAASRQFPAAATFGIIAAKFNASPLTAFKGQSFVGGLKEVGAQALEEGLQGGSGQLNQNLAIKQRVDPTQALVEGVGEQVGVGAIAGAGMAGLIGAPQMGREAVVESATLAGDAFTAAGGTQTAQDIMNGVMSGVANVTDGVSNAAGATADFFKPAADAARPFVEAAANKVNERFVKPGMEAASEYMNKSDKSGQAKAIGASLAAQGLAEQVMKNAPSGSAVTDGLTEIATPPATPSIVPASFSGSVQEDGSVIQNVSGILASVKEKAVNIKDMTDEDLVFAGAQFDALAANLDKLPKVVQTQVQNILKAEDVAKIRERVANIDLNQSQTIDMEITPNVVSTTVAVAKANPKNVNPGVIGRILEQNTGDITPEQVTVLKAAAEVAQAVNDHDTGIVEMSKSRRAELSEKPDYVKNPKKLPPISAVSRSLKIKDANGMKSLTEMTNQIMSGAETGTVEVTDNDVTVSIPTSDVANQLSMLTEHMTNKVEALNLSYEGRQEGQSKGSPQSFRSIYKGKRMADPGTAGNAAPVTFQSSTQTARNFTETLVNDAIATVKVYNAMAKAFPDMFPDGVRELPTFRGSVDGSVTKTEVSGTQEDLSDTDTVQVTPKKTDTTADKTPVGSSTKATIENTPKGVKVTKNNINIVVEGPMTYITDFSPKAMMMTLMGKKLTVKLDNLRDASVYIDTASGTPSLEVVLSVKKKGQIEFNTVSKSPYEKGMITPSKDKLTPNAGVGFDINDLDQTTLPSEFLEMFNYIKDRFAETEDYNQLMAEAIFVTTGANILEARLAYAEKLLGVMDNLTEKDKKDLDDLRAASDAFASTTAVDENEAAASSQDEGVVEDEEASEPESQAETTPVETPKVQDNQKAEPKKAENVLKDKAYYEALADEDLLTDINESKTDYQVQEMSPEALEVMSTALDPVLEALGLKGVVRRLAWLTSENKNMLGRALFGHRVLAVRGSVGQNIKNGVVAQGLHVLYHELGHIVDSKASIREGYTKSMTESSLGVSGAVYKEIQAVMANDPEWNAFFQYAMGKTEKNELRSEVFAELFSIYVTNPDLAQQLFPKGTLYVESVIKEAGGDLTGINAIRSETSISEGSTAVVDQTSDVPPVTTSLKDTVWDHLTEKFRAVFLPRKEELPYYDATSLLDHMVDMEKTSDVYRDFANMIIPYVREKMSERLNTFKTEAKFGKITLKEAVKQGHQDALAEFVEHKSLLFVDTNTGEYDTRLLDLATLAVVDWLTSVRAGNPDQLIETIEEMDLNISDLTQQQLFDLMYGVRPRQATEGITRQVLKLWNMRTDKNAQMVDSQGAVESLVKEIIRSLDGVSFGSNDQDSVVLLKISQVPVVNDTDRTTDTATTFNVFGMLEAQKEIGIFNQGSTEKFMNPETSIGASIGDMITAVDKTQSRGNTKLSKLEQEALKNIQDIPHRIAAQHKTGRSVTNAVRVFDKDLFFQMLGHEVVGDLAMDHPLRASIMGKNLSIERDYEEAFMIVDGIEAFSDNDAPVFYPAGISKVGRHQMKGINPQNNKILRALVTPTHTTLDMTSKFGKDVFWLTVGQSSGLHKVENENHVQLLAEVQQNFQEKFGDALDVAMDFMETGTMDSQAMLEAMQKAGASDMAQFNAVIAVAQLKYAESQGTQKAVEFSLSFELDGKTDGPGNLMNNHGQGELSEMDYQNMQRVGHFLGMKDMTLNRYYETEGNVDLYDFNSQESQYALEEMVKAEPNPAKREQIRALLRFSARFGELKVDPKTGDITLTRSTSKGPVTQTVYGAAAKGVSATIADAMLMEFYRKMNTIPAGTTVEDHLQYAELKNDFSQIFGMNFDSFGSWSKEYIQKAESDEFRTLVQGTIGQVLSDTTKAVIGDQISLVNETIVMMTSVQSVYTQMMYDKLMAERLEELAVLGIVERNKKGVPIERQMSRDERNKIIEKLTPLTPIYQKQGQTLTVGSFSPQARTVNMSATHDSKMRYASSLVMPEASGVKALPYLTISTDGMMMNRIFTGPTAVRDVIPVFDGVDMAMDKIFDNAGVINAAVQANWDQDTLSPVVNNFTQFMDLADADMLAEAFAQVKGEKKKTIVRANTPAQLMAEIIRMRDSNNARKAVFKRIARSVDHMGGSSTSHQSGGREATLAEINKMIRDEMNGVAPAQDLMITNEIDPTDGIEDAEIISEESAAEVAASQEKTYVPTITVTSARDMATALIKSTKNASLKASIKAILPMLPADLKIVRGDTTADLNAHRGPDMDALPEGEGLYDINTNTIYLLNDTHETLAHELIHAATFAEVLSHYEGNTNAAVERLEALMTEFMATDFLGSKAAVRDAANKAMASIIQYQTDTTPLNQASALNEFMAWALSNEALMKDLKTRETGVIARMSKLAKALMQRIMGKVTKDMWSNILFNTKILNEPPLGGNDNTGNGGNDGNGNGDNGDGGVTPVGKKATNFWIDLIKQRIAESKDPSYPAGQRQKLLVNRDNAFQSAESLIQGGFAMSDYQRRTYTAIHAVMAMELRLNTNSMIAMGKVFDHVTTNLTPAMFGGTNADQKYAAVMDLFGATKNEEGISDSIAVLLALSQTNADFRSAVDQLPEYSSNGTVNTESFNDILGSAASVLMQKAVSTIELEGRKTSEIMDALALTILRNDGENEFSLLTGLANNVTKADTYLKGAVSALAGFTEKKNAEMQKTQRTKLTKMLLNSVALATGFLETDRAAILAQGTSNIMHMGNNVGSTVTIREMFAEMVGTNKYSVNVVAMLDSVNGAIASMRQTYREELPVILQNVFSTPPTKEQWKITHSVLGKGDFQALFDLGNPDAAFRLIKDEAYLNQKLSEAEATIRATFSKKAADNIMEKGFQLANKMAGNGDGHMLIKNAYAINRLAGDFQADATADIDRLVSLMALRNQTAADRAEAAAMYDRDPEAMTNLAVYLQALNKEEDLKTISPTARMNGYKGFLPDHGKNNVRIEMDLTTEESKRKTKGWILVGTASGVPGKAEQSYYVSNVKRAGSYSQGVMQTVQDSYRGVDATTGLTVNGTSAGAITYAPVVDALVDEMNSAGIVGNSKETITPVYDETDGVLYFEKIINPDIIADFAQPSSNLAMMLGVWAGRQVEEKFAQEYNRLLVTELKRIFDERGPRDDGLYTDISDPSIKDAVYADSWAVIPPKTKEIIAEIFGSDGFPIRNDMINLSVGYREPSITDVWSGKTRFSPQMSKTIQQVAEIALGKSAMVKLSKGEETLQGGISYVKDIIVVKSLVVPYMNTQSNVFQLQTRGVGVKRTIKGYRDKFVEIDKYNENVRKVIALETEMKLKANDKNAVRLLQDKRQVIWDENARMSVAPMIVAGAYKNISEGITELDVELTTGGLADWIESKVNTLSPNLQTAAKYGMLSKDTALYRGANKMTQYGDFIAKSIYYDFLTKEKGKTNAEALAIINEEYINFSVLPGRMRSGLEASGLTWFMSYKIRVMKVAGQMLRENPARALVTSSLGDIGGTPMDSNLLSKIADGTIDYSLGFGQALSALELHPTSVAFEEITG